MPVPSNAAELLLAFVALYPVATGALWIAGGLLFRGLEEEQRSLVPAGWPGVTVLIPAFNEELVIATSVRAALDAEYPLLELLVLDDGSTDETEHTALEAAGGDPRCRVIRDPVNRGKAEQLNTGFREAAHELVLVTDADTQMHPQALKRLVSRIAASDRIAAVAGAPHVTNRDRFLATMQILEAASIIGLIRRTQALTGRVGTVAGVLGLFRRDFVLAVGGYDPRMATEDIELTWRLLAAGWETAYEPRALVGMQVPVTWRALWAQRRRWARGQGEVLRTHLAEVVSLRHRWMWLMAIEALCSFIWVWALVVTLVIAVFGIVVSSGFLFGFSIAWGVAISILATVQVAVALFVDSSYDRRGWRAFLIEPLYPLFFWCVSGLAALTHETRGLLSGPRNRVVWDIPRDRT